MFSVAIAAIRYELVDDIVYMAARGRYVPKAQNGDNRFMLINIGSLAYSLDISINGPPEDNGSPRPEKPAVSNLVLVKHLTQTDPSNHDGSKHFPDAIAETLDPPQVVADKA